MSGEAGLDPDQIPHAQAERRQLAGELREKAQEAFGRGALQAATLHASDLLMLYPNERHGIRPPKRNHTTRESVQFWFRHFLEKELIMGGNE